MKALEFYNEAFSKVDWAVKRLKELYEQELKEAREEGYWDGAEHAEKRYKKELQEYKKKIMKAVKSVCYCRYCRGEEHDHRDCPAKEVEKKIRNLDKEDK